MQILQVECEEKFEEISQLVVCPVFCLQDLADAMSAHEISESLHLHDIKVWSLLFCDCAHKLSCMRTHVCVLYIHLLVQVGASTYNARTHSCVCAYLCVGVYVCAYVCVRNRHMNGTYKLRVR